MFCLFEIKEDSSDRRKWIQWKEHQRPFLLPRKKSVLILTNSSQSASSPVLCHAVDTFFQCPSACWVLRRGPLMWSAQGCWEAKVGVICNMLLMERNRCTSHTPKQQRQHFTHKKKLFGEELVCLMIKTEQQFAQSSCCIIQKIFFSGP